MAAIELRDVSFKYLTADEKSVENVSFSVEVGELCAIIGPNGSGKTTICNIIRGFIPRFHKGELGGSVLIEDEDIVDTNLGALAPRIGFVFQNPFVQISGSKDTVFEEVAFGLENLGVDVETISARVDETLLLVNIDHLRDTSPFDLSGGQKQRVAFASILAMDPPIYVIDEPTSQLDPQSTDQIFDIIKLLKDKGKTIVLVEHKMELVAQFADRVVVLDGGRVVMNGTTTEVFSSPELANHKVAYPQYAAAGLSLRESGVTLPRISVIREEAIVDFGRALQS
ncbi:MAG: ABC transporter ATP-binding protein [Microbacteriaceae bacterium]|nr:MAG: ABC transporter ATP-binding protein [Microbacteriaceae bacterium]